MRKNMMRIVSMALAVAIGVGAVCYKTPKAEASLTGVAAFSVVASAFLTCYGINITSEGYSAGPTAVYEDLRDAFERDFVPGFIKMKEDAAAAAGEVWEYTEDLYKQAVVTGAQITDAGKLVLTDNAAKLLAYFREWFIEAFGLDTATSPVVFAESLTNLNGVPALKLEDDVYYYFNASTGFVNIASYTCYRSSSSWSNNAPIYLTVLSCAADNYVWPLAYSVMPFMLYSDSAGGSKTKDAKYDSESGWYYFSSYPLEAYDEFDFSSTPYPFIYGNDDIDSFDYYADALLYFLRSILPSPSVAGYFDSATLAAMKQAVGEDGEEIEDPPVLAPGQSLSIDMGLSAGATEEDFINAIGQGVKDGTLTAAGTVTEGAVAEEDDDDVTILSWTKKIWQSVIDLPDRIANAIAKPFTPSAEYLAALPSVVTETFDNRTGFLTYPFSVLSDFVGRLSDTSSDFVIEWPNVNEPFTGERLIAAGRFNVSQFVGSNSTLNDFHGLWYIVCKGYLVFAFLKLCRRKYDSIVGDRLGV